MSNNDLQINEHNHHHANDHGGMPLQSLETPQSQNLATQSQYGDSGTEDSSLSILNGSTWGGNGSGITLNYNFLSSVPFYYNFNDQERTNFASFNSQMQTSTIAILNQLETFTNITFNETDASFAQLTFAQALLPDGTGAWAYFPNSHPKGGDVWTNNLYSNTQNPVEGNYAHFVLMHEIGHALGLNHSFDTLSGIEASSQYSVMAYNWDAYFPATYMLYDIYALQNLYGANMSHATGNDIYTLNSTLAYTIWDAGGNDTLNASHMSTSVTLNLNDGFYSSVGLENNIAIAFGAIIENATGGSGNDKITGNEYSNILLGNAGSDIFIGSGGNDIINGGTQTDTIIYETNIENFLISIIDSITVTLTDIITNYAMDTIIAVENFIFNNLQYSFDTVTTYATSTEDPDRPTRPTGSILTLKTPSSGTIINDSDEINLSTATAKTIGISFETSADVSTRQVLFEQGGGLRGLSIYIENGELHHAAWNYKAGGNWGFKSTSVSIDANTRYTTTLLFDAISKNEGSLTLYLNGIQQSSVSGVGYIYSDDSDVGIGMMRDESRFSDGNKRGDGYEFSGTVDQLTYYNHALAPAEINSLSNNLNYQWLINLEPNAQDDTFTILTNIASTFNVTNNDSDPNGDIIDVTSVSSASHGSVTLNADDTLLYNPNSDFIGTDSFTYTITDPDGLTHTATVTVTVTDEIAPKLPAGSIFELNALTHPTSITNSDQINLTTATEKTIGVSFETSADISSRQVLFEQGGSLRGLSIYIENGELHHAAWNYRAGTQWGFKSNSINIDANTRYTTTLLFDATSQSQGTLTLYLNGIEQTSINGLGYIFPDESGTGIGQMIDESRFSDGNKRGDDYVFSGNIEQIAYYNQALTTTDIGQLNSTLEYNWLINLAPTPQNDDLSVTTNTSTLLNVLENDNDPNGDALDIISVTDSPNGSITLNSDDTILYSPDTDFEGLDSFTYTVSDENGLTTTATVNVTVSNSIKPDLPNGSVFAIDTPTSATIISDSAEINLATATEKTIGVSFETSTDISTRQVLFEQGGGLRGLSIFIEDGQLHHAAWNYKAGGNWGFKSTSVSISASTDYTTTLIYEATSNSNGTLNLYLNGIEQSSINGVGYIYKDSGDVGIGMMRDESRFSDGNKRGNGYQFAGTINKISYYNKALSDGDLRDLNDHLSFTASSITPDNIIDINQILEMEQNLIEFETIDTVSPLLKNNSDTDYHASNMIIAATEDSLTLSIQTDII